MAITFISGFSAVCFYSLSRCLFQVAFPPLFDLMVNKQTNKTARGCTYPNTCEPFPANNNGGEVLAFCFYYRHVNKNICIKSCFFFFSFFFTSRKSPHKLKYTYGGSSVKVIQRLPDLVPYLDQSWRFDTSTVHGDS